jgi:hypothetical protein
VGGVLVRGAVGAVGDQGDGGGRPGALGLIGSTLVTTAHDGVCTDGWICEAHPDRPFPHDDCAGTAMLCRTKGCPHLALSPHDVYDVIGEALLSVTSSTESEKIEGVLGMLVPPRPWQ